MNGGDDGDTSSVTKTSHMNRKDFSRHHSLPRGRHKTLSHESVKLLTIDSSSNVWNKATLEDSIDDRILHGENDSSPPGDLCKGPSDDHLTGNVTQRQFIHSGFDIDSSVHNLSSDQISVTHSLLEFPDDDRVPVAINHVLFSVQSFPHVATSLTL